MRLLFSTEQNSHFTVAVGRDEILKLKTVRQEYRQSELLLRTIDKLLGGKKAEAIFVVRGPGAFAALRVGIATANALGLAWMVPVVGVKLKKSWLALNEKSKINKVWRAGLAALKKGKFGSVEPCYDRAPNITVKK